MGTIIPMRSGCFCGSGKDYRACCFLLKKLPKGASMELKRRYWKKLLVETLLLVEEFTATTVCEIDGLLEFTEDTFFDDRIVDEISGLESLTMLLALTRIDLRDFSPEDFDEDGAELLEDDPGFLLTPALFFLLGQDEKFLKSDKGKALQQAIRAPLTFYQVLATSPKESVRLRDLLLDKEIVVVDKIGSLSCTCGEIIFAQVCTFDDISIFGTVGSSSLDPTALAQILSLREQIIEDLEGKVGGLDEEALSIVEDELIYLYVSYMKQTLNHADPVMYNADGDEIKFFKISASIELSDSEIVQRLSDYIDQRSIKVRAETPRSVVFPLLLPAENDSSPERMVLGVVTIEHDSMTVEVNSEERADKVKELLSLRLDVSQRDVRLEQVQTRSFSILGETTEEDEIFLASAEGKKFISDALEDYHEKWFSIPIPALDDMTPLEATKTERGRLLLESLLCHYEEHNQKLRQGGSQSFRMNVDLLRQRLGL